MVENAKIKVETLINGSVQQEQRTLFSANLRCLQPSTPLRFPQKIRFSCLLLAAARALGVNTRPSDHRTSDAELLTRLRLLASEVRCHAAAAPGRRKA